MSIYRYTTLPALRASRPGRWVADVFCRETYLIGVQLRSGAGAVVHVQLWRYIATYREFVFRILIPPGSFPHPARPGPRSPTSKPSRPRPAVNET